MPGVLLAVVVGGPLNGVPASAQTPAFTKTSGYTKVVKLGPNADTSCDVNYDLYLPTDASATHRVPAILTTNGFGGSKSDQAGNAALWASHDYAVLSYSGLGFGGSSCLVYTDDPDWDGRAASQLIDFLGKQPQVLQDSRGPVVGTWGGSYGGGFQFALASVDTRVRAMVPEITWNDLAYSLLPNNDSPNFNYASSPAGVEKHEWAALFFSLGNAEPALNPGHSGWTNTDGSGTAFNGTPPNPACPGYELIICEGQVLSTATGFPTQAITNRLRHASAQYELFDKYPAGSLHFPPTLLAQGQNDTLFDVADAVANYRGFKSKGAPVKLMLKEGGHSGPAAAGEYNNSDPSKGYVTQQELNWFDHYLKHLDVSTGPEVEYFRDWVTYDTNGSAQPAYGSAPAWPVSGTQDYYLSGTSDLVASPTAVQPGTTTFTNTPGPTSYSETSEAQGNLSNVPPTDAPGTFASYTTAPLSRAIDSVGIPTIDLTISDANPTNSADPALNVVVFGKVYDVAPDGSVTLVHRIVSPVRISDASQPVHINLPGVVHEYAAGHRIELVLATSDAAYVGSRAVHALSITADPAHPTAFHLPSLSVPLASTHHGTAAPTQLAQPHQATVATGTAVAAAAAPSTSQPARIAAAATSASRPVAGVGIARLLGILALVLLGVLVVLDQRRRRPRRSV